MSDTSDQVFPPLIQFGDFEGPLDLLLHEVRCQNVAIENVRMAPITNRFLEYVRTAGQRNLNLDIDWLHMAATLIRWKSQSLLSSKPGVEPRDAIPDELIRQLLAHRKELAEKLAERRATVSASFSRGGVSIEENAISTKPVEPLPTTVWDMIQQAREIAAWIRQHREELHAHVPPFGVESDEVSTAEMIAYLQNQLAAGGCSPLDGLRLLKEQTSMGRRLSLFLAMLEMARDRQLEITQNACFASISLIATDQLN